MNRSATKWRPRAFTAMSSAASSRRSANAPTVPDSASATTSRPRCTSSTANARRAAAGNFDNLHAFNVRTTEAAEVKKAIDVLTDRTGVDVVLEMSGSSNAINFGLDIVRMGGTLSLLGLPAGRSVTINDYTRNVIFKGVTLHGIIGRRMYATWQRMLSLLKSGLDVEWVVQATFDSLHDFHEGIGRFDRHEALKVVFFPEGEKAANARMEHRLNRAAHLACESGDRETRRHPCASCITAFAIRRTRTLRSHARRSSRHRLSPTRLSRRPRRRRHAHVRATPPQRRCADRRRSEDDGQRRLWNRLLHRLLDRRHALRDVHQRSAHRRRIA